MVSRWPAFDAPAVHALAPGAIEAFDAVFATVATAYQPARLELVRRRLAMLLGLPVDLTPVLAEVADEQISQLAAWPSASVFDPVDRSLLEFAEQFLLDVAAIDAADRSSLTTAAGPDAFGVVQAIFVLDHGPRLMAVTQQLFGVQPFAATPGAAGAALWPALEKMMNAVITLDSVDPLTAELVRLRGARFHQCRLCQSRRRIAAVEVDTDLLEAPDALAHADLTEVQRAALQLTDAILLTPAAVPAGTLAAVRAQLSPAQALEVTLLVAHNAANKIAVALGADAPTVTDGIDYFSVDVSGSYQYGMPMPQRG